MVFDHSSVDMFASFPDLPGLRGHSVLRGSHQKGVHLNEAFDDQHDDLEVRGHRRSSGSRRPGQPASSRRERIRGSSAPALGLGFKPAQRARHSGPASSSWPAPNSAASRHQRPTGAAGRGERHDRGAVLVGRAAVVHGLPPGGPGVLHPARARQTRPHRRGHRDRLAALRLHPRLHLRRGTLYSPRSRKSKRSSST